MQLAITACQSRGYRGSLADWPWVGFGVRALGIASGEGSSLSEA